MKKKQNCSLHASALRITFISLSVVLLALTGAPARNQFKQNPAAASKNLMVAGPASSQSLFPVDVPFTFSNTGSLTYAHEYHTATLLPNGKVLVAGGFDGGWFATAELYDPASGTWSTTGSLTNARAQHTATLLPNGTVLVAGGVGTSGFLSSAELYNPTSGTWSTTGSLNTARLYHTATLLPNGTVLVAGGAGTSGYLSSAELYDPANGNPPNGAWSTTGSLGTARGLHTATLLPNGKVLVTGGYNPTFGDLSSAELYDIGLGFVRPDWQPEITTATSPLMLGSSLMLTGSRFQGFSQASGGNVQDSSTNYPVVQLRDIDNSEVAFLQVDPIAGWSDTTFTSPPVNFPPGPALLTVFANGIPSNSTYVLVAASAPSPTPTPSPSPTATPEESPTPTPPPSPSPTPTPGQSPTPTPTAAATATATTTPTPTPTPTPTAAATNLTVTAASGTYGGTSTTFTATLTRASDNSPVNGETVTFTLNGVSAGSGVTDGSGMATSSAVMLCGSTFNVGSYGTGAAASFAGDISFGPSSGSGTLAVTKANATVIVAQYTVPYDGNPHTATVTSITGVCGETGATVGTVDVSGTTHVMANIYNDTWTFTGSSNYNDIGPTAITDTISRINATWTTSPASKHYGDADPVPLTSGSGSGFTSGDSALITATYTRVAGETVLGGPYQITATLGPTDVVANYNITNNGANFTITPKPATWITSAANKTYGNMDPNPLTTGSGSGFLAADNVTATYSRVSGETVLGGPYLITATLSPGDVLSNYSITNNGANFTITPKLATWTTNAASKIYGGPDPNPLTTGSGSGFLPADNVTATYNRVAGETVPGGPYPITAILSGVLSNYAITNLGANFTIMPRSASVTADPQTKIYGANNPTLTATVSGTVNGDTLNYTLSTDAIQCSNIGPYTITVTLGSNPNYSLTPNNGTLTITKAHLTVTAVDRSVQYSDPLPTPTPAATITGFVCNDTAAVVSGSPAFSTAANITFTNAGGVSNAPGTYTSAIIPSVGSLSAVNYDLPAGNFISGTLTVTQEDARAYYTGPTFADTAGPNSSTATVTLSATIKDITAVPTDPAYDPYPGDIRNATVTFINRETNTPIVSNLPVALVNNNDTTVGTVTYNWSVNLGSALSQSFTIGIIVNNYYTDNSSAEDSVVTVSVPPAAGQITGGGYLVMQNSAGQYSGGVGTKNNFGFNVQNAHNGLHGSFNTIIRSNGHTYQIKGNSMTSLTTQAITMPYTASFTGKASLQDITDSLHPISIDGNATLQATMTDRGDPGSNDTIGITVWAHAGGLYFSSNWNGTTTVEQTLGGGNIQVH